MPNIEFAGFLYNNAGTAIAGATVELFPRNTTGSASESTTTSSTGYWAMSESTEGRYDVRITSGSSVRFLKYDASAQMTSLEVANFRVRNPADTFEYDVVPAAIVADRTLNLPLITATRTLIANDTAITDSENIVFGTGGDATIDYDGTDLVISPAVVGSGDLKITGGSVLVADSEGVTLGTGKDATIQYDGSDLVISPAAVGTGDVKISGGSLEVVDSEGVTFGTGGDASIQYDGSNLIVAPAQVGTGDLVLSGGGVSIPDTEPLILGTGGDAQILWSTGDSDNHALVIAVGDSNQGLHVTDLNAKATDWDIAATTHPNVYIHSNTTPATDFLRLGDHDGTNAVIDVVGGTTLKLMIAGSAELDLTATALAPSTSDGNALGTGSLMWADLFLASGAVVNFNNGAETITHSANKLTLGGVNTFELTDDDSSDKFITVEQQGTGQAAIFLAKIGASNSNNAGLQLYQGSGNGSANNMRYDLTYDGGNGHFNIFSADTDGSATGVDVLRIPDGQLTIDGNTTFDANAFDYICEACGKNSADPFECCGVVSWQDDVALMAMAVRKDPVALEALQRQGIVRLYDDGQLFTSLNRVPWYLMSGMVQLLNRIKDLERQVAHHA